MSLLDTGTPAGDSPAPIARRRRGITQVARRLRSRPAVMVAMVFLLVLLACALLAPALAPYDPLDTNLSEAFEGPSAAHWLGTDNTGRDVASRLLHAARIALLAAAQGVGIALVLGVPAALFIGYLGGIWDRLAMRLVEALIALPGLVVAIAILAVLGSSLTNAMVALGLALSVGFFRVVRGSVLAVREELFIDATRVVGSATPRIVFGHILPNVVGPIVVQATLAFSTVLLAEAGLSFIGLGVQPPQASWGSMLATASQFRSRQPFLVIPPGVMIVATVLAFNVVGDGLRDALGLRRSHLGPPSPRTRAGRAVASAATPPAPRPGPAPTEATLLQVSDLEVSFPAPGGGSMTILTGVGFSLERGRTLGLVGESGCGKSMSALAVMGLIPAPGWISAGSIVFDGEELVGATDREMRRIRGSKIAMIFQEPMTSLNPAFTVSDQIGEVLRIHKGLSRADARRRAVELLDLVHIPGAQRRADHYPHQLSGGMAQRVMLAMALSCEPLLLIADEPTTALDVTIQAQILDLLSELQESLKMSVLFVTHDLGVVADICDAAAVMYAGEIVEHADAVSLFARPGHPYTAGLLASMPQNQVRTSALVQIPGAVPPPWNWPAGCRFHPRCSHALDRCRTGRIAAEVLPGDHTVACSRVHELELTTRP